jgi:hypothetical protein
MTFPGAETIKGGIIGEDCFRRKAGAPFVAGVDMMGSSDSNCERIVSTGECSGVWVPFEKVVRG